MAFPLGLERDIYLNCDIEVRRRDNRTFNFDRTAAVIFVMAPGEIARKHDETM